ncbi:CheR family methyltransferase [Methanoplanus endosymbiosus]|uniref:Methyltransferase domain-containing protein n=1 Tax=Methanoplanus endosymbiosus TaxID=33865 RepID=A0A9E7PP38_9EURY|nr:CheR family methyltransferase [Methanoplanus endosymbiosus]UUX92882.1 methyltransferase domain-containing protein [Methanoplanus endosymbiosus]
MAFTFFFRDLDAIKLIPEYVLPTVADKENITIWDAGCANGPEVYSLLIHLKENTDEEIFSKITVVASDIDSSRIFGEAINTGRYRKNQISSVPPEIMKRYFSHNEDEPDVFIIDEELREKISYHRHDLLSLKTIGNNFDIIICKHVLQHFTPEEQKNVIKMFYNSLAKEGFLLTEFSQDMPECFRKHFSRIVPDQNLYRKKLTTENINEVQ